MKFAALLLMTFCLYVTANQKTPITLCGTHLANARVFLCYGSEYVDKRGIPQNYLLDNLAEESNEELQWPWSGRLGSLSASWSRYKREGLADECCLKPCTRDVILSYC